ncbi:hypothetical protein L6164_004263 [Bauhinia variegata]|uniref:Uncharacterized protein n=1 Tax=Bauhinia variegata TaxID=167791 RepID=A0ACB9Q3B5_BAUVA|nr:hypothetical protein L6164_004263 [Bauhinia variegata]
MSFLFCSRKTPAGDEETEELANQVLDEIGIDINSEPLSLRHAKNRVAQAEATPTGNQDSGIDDDLQARLDNLRKI